MVDIQVSPEVLRGIYSEISELDEQIASASGSDGAGKRAIANSLANEHSEITGPVVKSVVDHVKGLSVEQQIAVMTALTKSLNDEFKDETDKFLTEAAEANKSDAPAVSDEELSTLLEKRREKNDEYKAIRNILEMFGQDVSEIPEPKRMTGSRGKRGPRTLSKFDYSIDGKPRSESQNSLSSIANTVCNDLGWKTKDLREFLVSQGLDIENPSDTWEYTLPNGKVISAVKSVETDEYEASDSDDEDDED